jgi:hypothetical protein
MKNFFIAAILIMGMVTSFAHAQTTPQSLATAVFDRVYAVPAGSCHDASVVLNENLNDFDFVYCAVIGDTLTLVNQRWTAEVYRSFGYSSFGRWEFTRFGPSYFPIEGYMGLFANHQYSSVVALGIVYEGFREMTVMILAFNRLN